MRIVEAARLASVHPRDVAHALSAEQLPASRYSDGIHVHLDDVMALDLDPCIWLTLVEWSIQQGTTYKAARRRIASEELDSVEDGPRSRWVLQPQTMSP